MYKLILKNNYLIKRSFLQSFSSSLQLKSNNSYTSDDQSRYPVPEFKPPADESLKNKKARLIYQSRKRGMLENGLLLSTFIHKYLDTMTEKQLELYDSLINKPSNDWDIYYWAVGVKQTPPEFDNEIMDLFKLHVQNVSKESRIRQPDLP